MQLYETLKTQTTSTVPKSIVSFADIPQNASFIGTVRVMATLVSPGSAGGATGDTYSEELAVKGKVVAGVVTLVSTVSVSPSPDASQALLQFNAGALAGSGFSYRCADLGNTTPGVNNWTIVLDIDFDD